jgi:hypothetical protein
MAIELPTRDYFSALDERMPLLAFGKRLVASLMVRRAAVFACRHIRLSLLFLIVDS